MLQTKFSVEENQVRFLDDFRNYGFKDRSAMLRAAIDLFKKKLSQESLEASADLYAEVFAEDDDLRDLTDAALSGWPE